MQIESPAYDGCLMAAVGFSGSWSDDAAFISRLQQSCQTHFLGVFLSARQPLVQHISGLDS